MISVTDPRPEMPDSPRRPWYAHLYAQVLMAIVAGVLIGHYAPETGKALKPLGDAFIQLVKMIIAPVIFLTIVTGIAGMRDLASRLVGRGVHGDRAVRRARPGSSLL